MNFSNILPANFHYSLLLLLLLLQTDILHSGTKMSKMVSPCNYSFHVCAKLVVVYIAGKLQVAPSHFIFLHYFEQNVPSNRFLNPSAGFYLYFTRLRLKKLRERQTFLE
jgi:hypothetical protein